MKPVTVVSASPDRQSPHPGEALVPKMARFIAGVQVAHQVVSSVHTAKGAVLTLTPYGLYVFSEGGKYKLLVPYSNCSFIEIA